MKSPRWLVEIVNPADGATKRWDSYESRERAESVAATLRQHKFYVVIRRIEGATVEGSNA